MKLFQLSNIETASLQSEIALKMAKETEVQVKLAERNEFQNRSILIFTVITVIFLPLSFFTSYFGTTLHFLSSYPDYS
jgi:Mg2+ and Co2+ transporter CorA